MMNLDRIQRAMFEVIRQPLTARERTRPRMPDGRSTKEIAEKIIKPNDRLKSLERLEIYNRVYWFRILSALAEDFPGLRAIAGQRNFDALIRAYLNECPSESFTLRNLGSRLAVWLSKHPKFVSKTERMAMDMVRLEWADIEAFDGAQLPALTEADLRRLGKDPVFHLQPHLQMLDFAHPVDNLLLRIRRNAEPDTDIVSNTVIEISRRPRAKRFSLPLPRQVWLVVYRHRLEDIVYFKRVEAEAFALLRALREGKRLSQAIETAFRGTSLPARQSAAKLRKWFSNWASLGWFCRNS
jgi:hypothetical protein